MNNEFLRKKPTVSNRTAVFSIFHKVVPILIIVFGFSLATQNFAYTIGAPDDLGSHLFITASGVKIYPPWHIVGWVIKYNVDDVYAPLLKKSTDVTIFFTLFGIVYYIVLSYLRGVIFKNKKIFGTARWANKKDLKKNNLLSNNGIVFGQLNNAIMKSTITDSGLFLKTLKKGQLIRFSSNTSAMLVAPARSGKGVSTIIPTLFDHPDSVIVFDPKGENYKATAGFRMEFSHVVRFSPLDKNSISINPIAAIRKDHAYRDASIIAEILLTPENASTESGTAKHFTDTAKDMITAAILHVKYSDYQDKSLYGVLKHLSNAGDPMANDSGKTMLVGMMNSNHYDSAVHEIIFNACSRNLIRPDRERGSVFSTAVRSLQILEDPLVRKNTTDNDFSFNSFFDSEKPISLYLTCPFSDIDRLSPIMRLLISFALRQFSSGETSFESKTLKIPILFIIDEFATLGYFPFLEKTMGILPGYRVRFLIVLQSLQQLNSIYKETHSFFDHCKTVAAFAPGDLKSAKIFSEMTGKESIVKESVSNSGSRFGIGLDNMNFSVSEQQRDILNPDEMMKLPASDVLILNHGMPPYIGKKVAFYDDPRFKKFINLPHPITKDEMRNELPVNKSAEDEWGSIDIKSLYDSDEIVVDVMKEFAMDRNPEGSGCVSKNDINSEDDDNRKLEEESLGLAMF